MHFLFFFLLIFNQELLILVDINTFSRYNSAYINLNWYNRMISYLYDKVVLFIKSLKSHVSERSYIKKEKKYISSLGTHRCYYNFNNAVMFLTLLNFINI